MLTGSYLSFSFIGIKTAAKKSKEPIIVFMGTDEEDDDDDDDDDEEEEDDDEEEEEEESQDSSFEPTNNKTPQNKTNSNIYFDLVLLHSNDASNAYFIICRFKFSK